MKPRSTTAIVVLAIVCAIATIWHNRPVHNYKDESGLRKTESIPRSKKNDSGKPMIHLFGTIPPQKAEDQAAIAVAAEKYLAAAYASVVNARTYRMTMTTEYSNGNYAIYDLEHLRSPKRGDLFICRTQNYDGNTQDLIPGRSIVEMTDENGNWNMSDMPGQQDVAFLSKTGQGTETTLSLHGDFKKHSAVATPSLSEYFYSITNDNNNGQQVTAILEASRTDPNTMTQVVVDSASGRMISSVSISPSMSFSQTFAIDVPIDEADFELPPNKIITPTDDLDRSEAYLYAKGK